MRFFIHYLLCKHSGGAGLQLVWKYFKLTILTINILPSPLLTGGKRGNNDNNICCSVLSCRNIISVNININQSGGTSSLARHLSFNNYLFGERFKFSIWRKDELNDLHIGFNLSILKEKPFILLSNNEFFISLKSFIEINELF